MKNGDVYLTNVFFILCCTRSDEEYGYEGRTPEQNLASCFDKEAEASSRNNDGRKTMDRIVSQVRRGQEWVPPLVLTPKPQDHDRNRLVYIQPRSAARPCDHSLDSDCPCTVFAYRLHPDHTEGEKKYYFHIAYFQDILRNMLKSASNILAEAFCMEKRHTLWVPLHFQKCYIQENAITRVRTTDIDWYYEGQSDNNPRIVVPLHMSDLQEMLCLDNDRKIPAAVFEDLRISKARQSHDWVIIPSGNKRKREDTYIFWRPLEKTPHPQNDGSWTCFPSAVASSLAILAKQSPEFFCLNHVANCIQNKLPMFLPARHPEECCKKWIEEILGEWGWDFESMPNSRCTLEVALENPSCAIVCRLKTRKDSPHVVAVIGPRLIDPAEDFVLRHNRKNLDLICGGDNTYQGTKWVYRIRKRAWSGLLKKANDRGLQVELAIPRTPNLFALSATESNTTKLAMAAFAAAACTFGLTRMAKEFWKAGTSKQVSCEDELCDFIDEVALGCARLTRTIGLKYGTKSNPSIQRLESCYFGVAKLKHSSTFVSFCAAKLFVPWMPAALELHRGNLSWIAGNDIVQLEWARFFHEY